MQLLGEQLREILVFTDLIVSSFVARHPKAASALSASHVTRAGRNVPPSSVPVRHSQTPPLALGVG